MPKENEENKNVQVSEQLTKLFDGTELSEEFKEQTTTLFEAAVTEKVNALVEEKEQELNEKYEADLDAEKESIAEIVNDYLKYVIEEWTNENQLAIESGLKLEMYEGFVESLREAFESMNVEVPEGKEDLVEKNEKRIDELESRLNESVDDRIALKKENEALKRKSIIESVGKDLTDTQREKLTTLIEDIEYVDDEQFAGKAKIIVENYFDGEGEEKPGGKQRLDEGTGVDVDEEKTLNEEAGDGEGEGNGEGDGEGEGEQIAEETKHFVDFLDRQYDSQNW